MTSLRVSRRVARTVALAGTLAVVLDCGARTGLHAPDAIVDVTDVTDVPDVPDACVPASDRCGAVEVCNNGIDDNCNGAVDEGCACTPGDVAPCFGGSPGRRNVGVCHDGMHTCRMNGSWDGCVGDIRPSRDVCNDADNLCDGCSRHFNCPILCPSPGDARVPDGQPYQNYALRGEDFYRGPARSWQWDVEGGPCDRISVTPSFTLSNRFATDATLLAQLSGDYTVKLTIFTPDGVQLTCTWVVHIAGPGVRFEMCYPENTTVDLDLYVHRPGSTQAWFPSMASVYQPNADACDWSNCEAFIRGMDGMGGMVPRANWGYTSSPLSACQNGPHGDVWRTNGSCANPRLDVDNNLVESIGQPENINIDAPREGESFRVMVQNFTGTLIARPLVNVYCGGRRTATYGSPGDEVPGFMGSSQPNIGAMWRVADVTTHGSGEATTCTVRQLHPPGFAQGYYVTYDDPSF